VSLSVYRILLQPNERNETFLIINQDPVPQQCKIWLKDFNYEGDTKKVRIVKDGQTPKNSAVSVIRYSPKTFVLPPMAQQNVKFSARRMLNQDIKEYRALVSINCEKQGDAANTEQVEQVSIKPRLVHNVPIFYWPNEVPLNMNLKNVSFDKSSQKLSLIIENNNERMVWGKLQAISKNGEVIASLDKIFIYPETKSFDVSLQTDNNSVPTKVIFTETQGGNAVVQVSL
jgi:hypothetical protein